jgi:hypothetical protein
MGELIIIKVVFFLLLIGFGVFHRWHKAFVDWKWLSHFPRLAIMAEVVILFLAILLINPTLLHAIFPPQATLTVSDQLQVNVPSFSLGASDLSVMALLLFPFLLFYLRMPRWKYLAAVLIPMATLLIYFHRAEAAQFEQLFSDLDQYSPAFSDLFLPKVWISSVLYLAAWGVLTVAPFVVGAIVAGRAFLKRRFVLTVAMTQFVVGLITRIYTDNSFLSIVFQTITVSSLAVLLFELPYLRKGIDQFIGEPVEAKRKSDFSTTILLVLQYSFMLVFGFCLTGSVFVNREFQRMSEKAMNPKPMYHSPAEVDAFTLLKESDFIKKRNLEIFKADLDSTLLKVIEPTDYDDLILRLKALNMPAVSTLMAENEEDILLFKKVGRDADYFGPVTNPKPHKRSLDFMMVHQVIRAVAGRAMIQMQAGESKAALEDIQSLYQFGGLLHENQVIGTAISSTIKKYANDVAWNFMVYHQDHPEELVALALMLKKNAKHGRQSFPFDAYMHYEGGLNQTISIGTMGGMAYNNFPRFYDRLENSWSQFDQLQITTALLRYRHEHGNWPKELGDLAPEFLLRIPLEPWNGKPYLYTFDETGATLERPIQKVPAPKQMRIKKFGTGFPFPVGGTINEAGK